MSPGLHAFEWMLLRAVIEGALVVGVIALLLRAFPRTPSSWAAFLWWLACGKFVLGLVPYSQAPWAVPVSIDLRPGPAIVNPEAGGGMIGILSGGEKEPQGAAVDAMEFSPFQEVNRPDLVNILKSTLLTIWIGGAVLCFLRGASSVVRSHRALATDSTDADVRDRQLTEQIAARMGLRTVPRVCLSHSAPAPHLLSFGAPTIVLPAGLWARLDHDQKTLILAHELVHVRRHDVLWSWLPWFVECAFWFHPFAKIAAAEFAIAREAACDEEVLQRLDASPRRYGELLLSLGAAPKMAWAGIGVAPGFRSLRRRISMLDRAISFDRRRSILVLALAVLATFLPVRFEKGAEAMTADNMCTMQGSPAAPPVPPTPPAPPPGVPTSSSSYSYTSNESGVAAVSSIDDEGNVAAIYSWDDGDDDKCIYVFDGKDVRMMGHFDQSEHARVVALQKSGKVQIIERDGSSVYVIDDPKLLKQARDLFRALEPLEKKQSELGVKQSHLGVKQSKLGTKQSELGLQMARLGEEMAELQVQLQERIQEELDTSELEAQIEAIGNEMGRLGEKQGALGGQQSQLGEQQSKLGELQSAIGEEQSQKSEEVREALEDLIAQAKEDGLARQVEE
jgi:beta-lactamase regulating signal transducer with metallopeptidase domain